MTIQEAVKQIAVVLERLTAEERREAFGELFSLWCQHCGRAQPLHGYCQCMNDE